MVLFQIEGKIFQVPLEQWKPIHDQFAEQCRAERDEVIALGGLHILGTERHEARRIDNQLRGRAGRQGDPGSSRFYLSLEDDLLRVFGGERVKALMYRLGMTEGVPIESKLITRRIENAQKAVEAQNFEARKHLLEYDDVMNKQRETIYSIRRSALEGKDQKEYALGIAEDLARELVEHLLPARGTSAKVERHAARRRSAQPVRHRPQDRRASIPRSSRTTNWPTPWSKRSSSATKKRKRYSARRLMRWLERRIILDIVDTQWKDHLYSLDHLKEGIGLRGYGQKDPLVEFKKEAFTLFEEMMDAHRQRNHALSLPHPARAARRAEPAKSSAARSASNSNSSIRPVRPRPKRPSRFAPAPRSAATIPAPAAAARNTRSATARPRNPPRRPLLCFRRKADPSLRSG